MPDRVRGVGCRTKGLLAREWGRMRADPRACWTPEEDAQFRRRLGQTAYVK
jgi:hypothetical protein